MVIYQGESFTDKMLIHGTNGYDVCQQIVICIYRKNTNDNKIYFVKNQDINYPDALLIDYDEEEKLLKLNFSSENTKALKEGEYMVEVKRIISDTSTLIAKHKIFDVIKSNL